VSRLLAYMLLGLVLFVGYHGWSKQQAAPPPPPTTAGAAKPSSKPAPSAVAPPSQLPPPDLGQIRMADPDPLPAGFAQAALLNKIRQVLEQGNTAAAQVRLLAIPKEALTDPAAKKYIAVLWNNLGVLQAGKGGGAAGIAAFKTAVSLDPGDPRAHINLTHAMWESKDPGLNKEFLEKTISLAPNEPLPHLALADMLYDKDDLAGAAAHLDLATQRATQDAGLQSYLQFVSAKVNREVKTEQKFVSRDSSHFTVKFDGNEDDVVWRRVSEILEDAYREIGQKFGYFPGKPIMVVLHSRENFQGATGSPAWADGLFDPIGGRIKVPTQGALTDQAWLTRVLRHEYVHALLHERMGGRLGAVPTWLNEGLAMQLAGDPWPDLDKVIRSHVTLIKLSSLEGPWGGLPSNVATVAYMEGNSATIYLMDRFGMEKVREVLGQLANGQTMAAAVQDRLFITYEQFQQRWIDELNEKMKAGRS
jgi:hypothetical protein